MLDVEPALEAAGERAGAATEREGRGRARGRSSPQTSMISASFFFRTSSISLDVLVRELLDLGERVLLVVLADLVVLQQLLQVLVGVAAHVADRDPALLGVLVGCFTRFLRRSSVSGGTGMRMILPSFWGLRSRSDVRIAFSIAGSSDASQGWMRDQRRVGHGEVADLVQRRRRAVVVDA